MLRKFFKNHLDAAEERGTHEQQNDMSGALSEMSKEINELSDMMGGRRKANGLAHHRPKDLVNAVFRSIDQVIGVRKEIEK